MTIDLTDNAPRVSYTVSEGATQTSFTVPFEFFDAVDLKVVVDGTTKTITTHYILNPKSYVLLTEDSIATANDFFQNNSHLTELL